ncbi:unnamed protein product [Rhodiola kirilowii]
MRKYDRINAYLPDELIIEIFRRLDAKSSRDACSLVCKRWLKLERLSRTTLRIGASGSPDLFVHILSRRFSNATRIFVDERLSIALPAPPGRRRNHGRSPKSSLKVKSSSIYNGSDDGELETYCLSDVGLTYVGEGFKKLEKLSLIWCSNVSSVGLISLAERCRALKYLDLQGCYVGDPGIAAVGACCKQFEEINLRFCEGLSDAGVIELVKGCSDTLKVIGIAACAKITDVSLNAVGSHCQKLETLSLDSEFIHNEGVLAVARGCPLLKVLKLQCVNVTDEALQSVGSSCQSLEQLALYSFQRFTDKSLRAIGNGCKRLKDLTLSDCFFLSDKGLESVAAGCTELTHIEVNGCHNIGTNGLESIGKSCKQLLELALLYCQRVGNQALVEVGHGCKFLQALHLVDCSSIGDAAICAIAEGCRNLRKLHIRRCYEIGNKGIAAVGRNCKHLSDLSLRFCVRVGDEGLIAVGEGCSLEYLNVSGCHHVGDAAIIAVARGCPDLRYLDASVLSNLGDMAMAELADGCPQLKEIVLSHCHKITNVGLSYLVSKCKLLETCHMVYCPGITFEGVATVVSGCANIKKILVEKGKVSERTKRRAGSIISYLCVDL